MRYLIVILLIFGCYFSIAQTQPSNFPVPNAPTAYYKIGTIRADSMFIPAYRDTNFLPRYNGTLVFRPPDKNFYYYDSTALRWFKLISSSTGLANASQGLIKNGDTVQLGQPITDHGNTAWITQPRYIRINNSIGPDQINSGALIFNNNNIDTSNQGASWNSYVTGGFQTSYIYGERRLQNDSSRSVRYGAIITLENTNNSDTTLSTFSPASPQGIGLQGVYTTGRIVPQKTTYIFSGPHGQSGALFRGAFDVGYLNQYAIYVTNSTATPNYPLAGIHNTYDLDRSGAHGPRIVSGSGLANFLADSRSYQSNINAGTTEYGSRMGRIYDFASYGVTLSHSESPSKAKTLAVSQYDTLVGFISLPKWKSLNEVLNGYSFVSLGNNDQMYIEGKARIGGIMPTVANGGQQWAFEVRDTTTNITSTRAIAYMSDSGSTFNTTSASYNSEVLRLESKATRTTGSNSLVNIALHAKANSGQDSVAIFADSGTVKFGLYFNNRTYFSSIHTTDFTTSTINTAMRQEASIINNKNYLNDGLTVPINSFALDVLNNQFPGASLTLTDYLRSGGQIGLYLNKRAGFTGTTTITARTTPANGTSTMASGLVGRLDASRAFASNDSLITTGWLAAYSSVVTLSAFNFLDKVAWINTGAGQNTANARITNGYGIYINPLLGLTTSNVTNRYALFQEASTDTNAFAGPTYFANNYFRLGSIGNNGRIQMVRTSDAAVTGDMGISGAEFIINGSQGFVQIQASAVAKQYIKSTGVTIGSNATASFNTLEAGYLRFQAGDSCGNCNPIKFEVDGARLLTIPVRGAFEAKGDFLMYTDSTTVTRDTLATRRWVRSAAGGGGSVSDFIFTDGNGFDGTVTTSTSTPTLSLTTTLTTGSVFYAGASGAISENNAGFFFSGTNLGVGTASPDRLIHAELADAVTNTVSYPFRMTHITSGTAAINFEVAMEGEMENASGTNVVAGSMGWFWSDPVNATEDATFRIRSVVAGSLTSVLTLTSVGTLTVATSGVFAGTTIANSITTNGNLLIPAANQYAFNSRSVFTSPANSIVLFTNAAATDFDRIDLGGTSSSFPALQRNGVNLRARLADGSASTDLEVLDEAISSSVDGSLEVPTKNAVYDYTQSANYTSTITDVANVTSSTFQDAYFIKTGNFVIVYMTLLIDPTVAVTQTQIELSLPVASDIGASQDCTGFIGCVAAGDVSNGQIVGSVSNNTALVTFTAGAAAGNNTYRLQFMYKII